MQSRALQGFEGVLGQFSESPMVDKVRVLQRTRTPQTGQKSRNSIFEGWN